MGGIGVLLRFEKMPEPSRLEELHRALWKCIYSRLEVTLTSKLTSSIRVGYISAQPYGWYNEGGNPFFGNGVSFTFRDGGDDFPLKYASYHWTDRVCVEPVAFAQLQLIAKRFGAELAPRPWYPPETIYFPLDGGDALVGVYEEYLDISTHAGLVRVDFAECPILDHVRELVASKRCLCEACRQSTDSDPGPRFDPEFLAGIPWFVEVPEAPETFSRIDAASKDEGLEFPVEEIAALTGVARRKAELLIALSLGTFDEDKRVPSALMKLHARWAAPVLFLPMIYKDSSYTWRETLRESVRALLAKPPVTTTGELIDADGIPILVFKFVGEYVDEKDAKAMRADTDALQAAHPDAQGMVLDATELQYTKGKGLDDIVKKGRPRGWAISSQSRGLHAFIKTERELDPNEWLFPSRDAAIAAVRARVVAEVYEIHDARGVVIETARREPRGRRHFIPKQEDGVEVMFENLFYPPTGLVEMVRRGPNGPVRLIEYPLRDAQGENEACRVGAQLTSYGGELYKINFSPEVTDLPLPLRSDWIDGVAARPVARRVALDRTNVTSAEILQLLERCPHLEELYLHFLHLDAELFASPLLGKLKRLQIEKAVAPPGAVELLAVRYPKLSIDVIPAPETDGESDTAPKPPVEITSRLVEGDGGPIAVVSFAGEYDAANATRMKDACGALLTEHPDVLGIVLDATNLGYLAGIGIGDVIAEGRPYGWAMSPRSCGLFHYYNAEQHLQPREWISPSVDDAIAAVRARAVADSYEVHANNGALWFTWRRESRGRRKCGVREIDGERLFDLRGRIIQELNRKPDGNYDQITEFPVRDASGFENDACRLGARTIKVGERLITIDFNVERTKLSLPADWVDRVAPHPTVNTVVLDGTGVATAKILELLERCPQVDRLYLQSLQLDAELFASPLLAKLKYLAVWGSTMPPGAIQQLAKQYPSLEIYPKP